MIPQALLLRLLRNTISAELSLNTDPEVTHRSFMWHMGEGGWVFSPSYDLEDISTLARIAAGEGWE